ncbi:hypothetical protein OAC90_00300 [Planktomarina sp.]|nr:hypothetical protein [Planktomarina sp.]
MVHYFKSFGLALLLTLGLHTVPLHAASFDCAKATTEAEITICGDPNLSALDDLASAFSYFVGLRVNLENVPKKYEYLTDGRLPEMTERLAHHYADGISILMTLLYQSSLEELSDNINALPDWSAEIFSKNSIMIIKPNSPSYGEYIGLQEGVIVFDNDPEITYPFDYRPVYQNLLLHINRSRRGWEFNLGILSEKRYALGLPAGPSTTKYRFQDNCWREIGYDSPTMVESTTSMGYNVVGSQSTNLLTGITIETLKSGEQVVTTSPIEISCLSDR